MSMSPEQLARRIAELADSKLATDIVALEVGEIVGYTDVLVICTNGTNTSNIYGIKLQ